jgi:hypothetical protein
VKFFKFAGGKGFAGSPVEACGAGAAGAAPGAELFVAALWAIALALIVTAHASPIIICFIFAKIESPS